MDKSKIVNLINKGIQENDFSGSVELKKLNIIEESLSVILPKSYKWFVQNYGHGGIGGLEILGVSKADIPSCVRETERFRKLGLPLSYIVIENCDEWIYCLDTSDMLDNECSVVEWDRHGNSKKRYKDFESYICDRLEEALERMEINE